MYLFENKVTSQHFGRPAGGLKQINKDKNNTLLSKWQLLSNPIPTNAKVVLGLVPYLVGQYDNSQKWEKCEGTFRRFETMKIQLYAIYERHKQHISYSWQGLFRGPLHWAWNRGWLSELSNFTCQSSRPSFLGCECSGWLRHDLAQGEQVHQRWPAHRYGWSLHAICCSGRLHSTLRIPHIQWRISGKADTQIVTLRGWRDYTNEGYTVHY